MPSVLDHGCVELLDKMGTDLTVVNAARVSFHKKSERGWKCPKCGKEEPCTGDPKKYSEGLLMPFCCGEVQRVTPYLKAADRKLVRYLLSQEHTAPLRHCQLTFRVKAPIFVFRQWMKHRIASDFNEVSSRYVDLENAEFYEPEKFRNQSKVNKQGSEGEIPEDRRAPATNAYRAAIGRAKISYESLRDSGVAKEQARCVMPVSQYSEVIWTASLEAVLHFLHLRLDSHAQWEIRQYAKAVLELVRKAFPVVLEEFEALEARTKADKEMALWALKVALADVSDEIAGTEESARALGAMRANLRMAVSRSAECYAHEICDGEEV